MGFAVWCIAPIFCLVLYASSTLARSVALALYTYAVYAATRDAARVPSDAADDSGSESVKESISAPVDLGPRCRLLRCATDVEVSPDGSPMPFEVPGVFRGVARFKTGGGTCSIAVRGKFEDAAAPDDGQTLWFGVIVGDDDEKPFASLGAGIKALAGPLLGLSRRLMGCQVRYGLGEGAPFIAFDAQSGAERFEVDDASLVEPPALGGVDVPFDAATPEKSASRSVRGKTVTLAWHTKYVDFASWRIVGLPALFGRQYELSRFWGDHPLRLVLFSEDGEGLRRYYFDLELNKAEAPTAAPLTSIANDAVAALLARDGSALAYALAATGSSAVVAPAFADAAAATQAAAAANDASACDVAHFDLCAVEFTRLTLCAALARSPALSADATAAALKRPKSTVLDALFDCPKAASLSSGDAASVASETALSRAAAKKPVAAILAVWERGWVCGTLELAAAPERVVFDPVRERGGLLNLVKAREPSALSCATADVANVRRVATPPAFAHSALAFFEFATSSRVWCVGVAGEAEAERFVTALAESCELARRVAPLKRDRVSYLASRRAAPLALHECGISNRLVLNRYRVVGTTEVLDVASAPGRALELLLQARDGAQPLQDALEAASALRAIPVASVAALRGAEATAFALNLHHLVIALAQLEGVLRDDGDAETRSLYPSVLEFSDSLSRASIVVAGRACSAIELEHGVIRKRASQPDTFLRGLLIPTPACALPLEVPRASQIARLGLALHAGIVASGPSAVPVYSAAALEEQLSETALLVARDSFAQSASGVRLPAVVRYYKEDYASGGTTQDVALAVLDFLPKGDVRERLRLLLSRRTQPPPRVYFGDFDVNPQRLRLRQD